MSSSYRWTTVFRWCEESNWRASDQCLRSAFGGNRKERLTKVNCNL